VVLQIFLPDWRTKCLKVCQKEILIKITVKKKNSPWGGGDKGTRLLRPGGPGLAELRFLGKVSKEILPREEA